MTALDPLLPDELTVIDDKRQSEALLEFFLPLRYNRRWGGHHDAVGSLPQHELAQNQRPFDGLAKTHVIGDEQVDARKAESLPERLELVGHDLDAGAERRLEERRIGRG